MLTFSMIKEIYTHKDNVDGKIVETKSRYSIIIKEGKVTKVFNKFNYSVEQNSFIFEYFSNKYNK